MRSTNEMNISDLFRQADLSIRTLRFYEQICIIKPQREGLNRSYGQKDQIRLQLIQKGKRVGFTLVAGREGRRTMTARGFFLGFERTALRPGEILVGCEVSVQPTEQRHGLVELRRGTSWATVGVALSGHPDAHGGFSEIALAILRGANGPILAPRAAAALCDPTSLRGIGYAKASGAGRLVYVYAWAGIATKPRDLLAMADAVGPHNDWHIVDAAREIAATGGVFVFAWGAVNPPAARRGAARARLHHVEALIRAQSEAVCALGINDGSPKHPLYVRADAPPLRWPETWSRAA